jgi:hypothetical protein
LEFKLKKIGLYLVLNENLPFFDHIYEANLEEGTTNMWLDQRFGFSHYSFVVKDITALMDIVNVKKVASNQKGKSGSDYDKLAKFKLTLASLNLIRFDLTEGPNPNNPDLYKSCANISD